MGFMLYFSSIITLRHVPLILFLYFFQRTQERDGMDMFGFRDSFFRHSGDV